MKKSECFWAHKKPLSFLLLGFLLSSCTPAEEAFVAEEIVKVAEDIEEELEKKK